MKQDENNMNTGPTPINASKLLALANKTFARVVDCDMRGAPITDCSVLLWGAHGNAVMRLVNRAVEQNLTEVGMEELALLAPEAFGKGLDQDFCGSLIVDYSILLNPAPYAYGQQTLNLVNLALKHASELSR